MYINDSKVQHGDRIHKKRWRILNLTGTVTLYVTPYVIRHNTKYILIYILINTRTCTLALMSFSTLLSSSAEARLWSNRSFLMYSMGSRA